jgi:serine/threonine protein kinase
MDSSPTLQLDLKEQFGIPDNLVEQIKSQYDIMGIIGKGSYGFVLKATNKKNGMISALKVMKNPLVTEYEIIKQLREI